MNVFKAVEQALEKDTEKFAVTGARYELNGDDKHLWDRRDKILLML